MSICCRNAWDENIIMNEDMFRELQYWYFHCNFLSFKSIVPMYRQPQRVIFTDASQLYCRRQYNCTFHVEKQDRDKSSTWRELKTVANNIQSLKNDLSGKFVKIYTDNQNVLSIVNKGSMKPELQDITLHIPHMCISNNIVLEMEWIPRDDNSYADYLSKLFESVIMFLIISIYYRDLTLVIVLPIITVEKLIYLTQHILHLNLLGSTHLLMIGSVITIG